MTLLERSKLSSGAAAAESAQASAERSRAYYAEQLRRQIQHVLSSDDMAQLIKANPAQAKNEIKSACRVAFSQPIWRQVEGGVRMALVESLLDSMFGFGPLEPFLADPAVTEIMVNGSVSVYVERAGRLEPVGRLFAGDDQVQSLIDRILGPLGRRVDESSPMVNARLPQGFRVNAIIPPLALDGPMLTIRKFSEHVMRLEAFTECGSMDAAAEQLLRWAVIARKNIAVSGGTGSGKTTLLNALSCLIDPGERIITIEDLAELRFLEHPHVVRLEARPMNAEGQGQVTIRDLVTNALRMRPDRIVVGECRGGEALDMLQAMNTGHDGSMTTLHANAPSEVPARLSTMVRYAVDLPVEVIEGYIASALDVVVQTARALDGRRYLSAIAEPVFNRETRSCEMRLFYRRAFPSDAPQWLAVPQWVDELSERGLLDGSEVSRWKRELRFA